MEDANRPFAFLDTEESRRHFAALDIALKSGRHIQNYAPDDQLFGYCEQEYEPLQRYYSELFKMDLRRGFQPEHYYYLQFREEERGRIPSTMVQKLDSLDVILGVLLLKYSEEKFLELNKVFTLEEVLEMLWAPENKDHVQRLFAKGADESYNSRDDERLNRRIKTSLGTLEELGWVRIVDKGDAKRYEVMPSLSRLSELYGNEIGGTEREADGLQSVPTPEKG